MSQSSDFMLSNWNLPNRSHMPIAKCVFAFLLAAAMVQAKPEIEES